MARFGPAINRRRSGAANSDGNLEETELFVHAPGAKIEPATVLQAPPQLPLPAPCQFSQPEALQALPPVENSPAFPIPPIPVRISSHQQNGYYNSHDAQPQHLPEAWGLPPQVFWEL